ncbi:hypothetical protein Tco_1138280, partial [Tanacetum coccineum]
FLALGWHLEDLHVTWAHLEKKQTRLRTYTKSLGRKTLSAWGRHLDCIRRRLNLYETALDLWRQRLSSRQRGGVEDSASRDQEDHITCP